MGVQSERVGAAAACAFALPFYLRDEFRLELVEELEIEVVLRREGLLADDRLHRLHVLACKCAREREVVEGREVCEVRVVEWSVWRRGVGRDGEWRVPIA